MQLLGHLALGYFSGTIASKYTKDKINLLLIWISSMLPDLDFFARAYIVHRGPMHSILLAAILFMPIYLVTRRGLPYFAALASHTLIGDYLNPPEMLFWPASSDWYGAPSYLALTGMRLVLVEVSLFALMAIVIVAVQRRSKSQENPFTYIREYQS